MNIDSQKCTECEEEFFVVHAKWVPDGYDIYSYHGKRVPEIIKVARCPLCDKVLMTAEEKTASEEG